MAVIQLTPTWLERVNEQGPAAQLPYNQRTHFTPSTSPHGYGQRQPAAA